MLLLLAGGSGRRMGRPKAFIDVDGQPLWRWMAEAFEEAGQEVVVSVGPDRFDSTPFPSVVDDHPDAGPLSGIAAVAGHDLIVWTVDVPDWTPQELSLLGEPSDAVAQLADETGHPQRLLSSWPAAITAAVPAFVADGGRAVRDFLESYPCTVVGEPRRRAHLTTPADLDDWLRSTGP